MTQNKDASAELARVVGPLNADIDTLRDLYLTRSQQAALDRVIAAAISSHGGGGEAVAATRVTSADTPGNFAIISPSLPKGTALYTTPQPRAEGMVLVPREPTDAMLDAAMQREDDEPLSDWGKSVPAPHAEIYKAMLAAAPGEGSGESLRMPTKEWVRIVQEEPTGEDPYACGYQAALCEVAKVLGTPPLASQSATPSDGTMRDFRERQALDYIRRRGATPSDGPDLALIADILDDYCVALGGTPGSYTDDAVQEQAELCRAADNAAAARTVQR